MKVYYRKAPGCFICTDRYVRPGGRRSATTSQPSPSRRCVSPFFPSVAGCSALFSAFQR